METKIGECVRERVKIDKEREGDEKSSARRGSRAFTQGWVQLQTQHSHPPFYGVVKCPSLLALASLSLLLLPLLLLLLLLLLHFPLSSSLPWGIEGGVRAFTLPPCVISFRCVAHAQKPYLSLSLLLPREKPFLSTPIQLPRYLFYTSYLCQSFFLIHRI